MTILRTARAVALVVTAAVAGTSLMTGAHAAGDRVAPSALTARDAISPSLTAAGDHGMLLTFHRPGDPEDTLYAVSGWHAGSAAPTWGRRVVLGRGVGMSDPAVAFNRDGAGVVVWGNKGNGGQTLVRTRTATGRWSGTYRIPHAARGYTGEVDTAVNAQGVVAVTATGDDSHEGTRLAVRRPGHAWRTYQVPGYADQTQVAVAADGTIELARGSTDADGQGSAAVSTLTPGGRWSTTAVRGMGSSIGSEKIYITGNGTQYLVLGRTGTWQSTDESSYGWWVNRHTILSRTSTTGPWTQVWDRDGAAAIQVVALQSRLRLTWIQYADPTSATPPVPQQFELHTALFPTSGATERVLATEDTGTQNPQDLPFTAAQSTTGAFAAGWRLHATSSAISPLAVWRSGVTRTYPDANPPATYDTQAQVACVQDRCWVARTTEQQVTDRGLVGGTVVVDPIG